MDVTLTLTEEQANGVKESLYRQHMRYLGDAAKSDRIPYCGLLAEMERRDAAICLDVVCMIRDAGEPG